MSAPADIFAADYVLKSDGNQWFVFVHGGILTSGQDPVNLLNSNVIQTCRQGAKILVLGDFSSATTLKFTQPVKYEHHGTFTYTGTGDAINLQETGAGQANSLYIYIWALIGPNNVSPYNTVAANAIGIHCNFAYQPHIWIDHLYYFTEGVRFDVSLGNFCSDGQWRLFGFQWCNIGIHWTGSASNINMQGHFMEMHMFACKTGILIDLASNASSGFNYFYGVCANVGFGAGYQDYVNNNNRVDNGASPNILCFSSSTTANASVLGPLDTVLPNPDYYQANGSTVTNQTTVGSHFPRIELQQKGIARSFTNVTSLAVTFPLQEPDTNYGVFVSFSYNAGAYWITSKTVSGCTINWVTANAGAQTLDYMLMR